MLRVPVAIQKRGAPVETEPAPELKLEPGCAAPHHKCLVTSCLFVIGASSPVCKWHWKQISIELRRAIVRVQNRMVAGDRTVSKEHTALLYRAVSELNSN